MSEHENLRMGNLNSLVCKVIFIGYLFFCAFIPIAIAKGLNRELLIAIQILISGLFLHHWASLTDYNMSFSGAVSEVYIKIDKIQFQQTKYLDLGFKTKRLFTSGLFVNERASKILAERYDITLLIISLLGEVLVFVSAQDQLNITRGLLSVLTKEFALARYFLAALGGYIFLWGFSLFLFGLVSKVNYMKGTK